MPPPAGEQHSALRKRVCATIIPKQVTCHQGSRTRHGTATGPQSGHTGSLQGPFPGCGRAPFAGSVGSAAGAMARTPSRRAARCSMRGLSGKGTVGAGEERVTLATQADLWPGVALYAAASSPDNSRLHVPPSPCSWPGCHKVTRQSRGEILSGLCEGLLGDSF